MSKSELPIIVIENTKDRTILGYYGFRVDSKTADGRNELVWPEDAPSPTSIVIEAAYQKKTEQQVQTLILDAIRPQLKSAEAFRVAELIEASISGERTYIPTGWTQFDNHTRAFMPGTITILAGNPGASKSFTVLQLLAQWVAQEIPVSAFMLEENLEHHLLRVLSQQSGLAGLNDPTWIRMNPDLSRNAYRDYKEFLDMVSRSIYTAPQTLQTLATVAKWIGDRGKAGDRIAIVDPVTAASYETNHSWKEDGQFIMKIQQVATEYEMSIILVTHPVKSYDEPSLSAISSGAAYQRFTQNIFWIKSHGTELNHSGIVRTPVGTSEVEYNRTIYILKARNGHGDAKFAFNFDSQSLTIHEKGIVIRELKPKKGEYED
jgi:KaiC/GvpD/RAD55 family RecA-like ATPase